MWANGIVIDQPICEFVIELIDIVQQSVHMPFHKLFLDCTIKTLNFPVSFGCSGIVPELLNAGFANGFLEMLVKFASIIILCIIANPLYITPALKPRIIDRLP